MYRRTAENFYSPYQFYAYQPIKNYGGEIGLDRQVIKLQKEHSLLIDISELIDDYQNW